MKCNAVNITLYIIQLFKYYGSLAKVEAFAKCVKLQKFVFLKAKGWIDIPDSSFINEHSKAQCYLLSTDSYFIIPQ
jgi:hypothetical protein